MNNFLPQGYEAPKSNSRYLKFKDGDNVFRILAPAVLGWEDWEEKQPIRTPYAEQKPRPIDPKRAVKHFWAFPVWDYAEKVIKILEITQSTIQEAIFELHKDEQWGDPTGYDINIRKSGKDLETKYSVIPRPPRPVHPEIVKIFEQTPLDLNQLFTGGDPFNPSGIEPSFSDPMSDEEAMNQAIEELPM